MKEIKTTVYRFVMRRLRGERRVDDELRSLVAVEETLHCLHQAKPASIRTSWHRFSSKCASSTRRKGQVPGSDFGT